MALQVLTPTIIDSIYKSETTMNELYTCGNTMTRPNNFSFDSTHNNVSTTTREVNQNQDSTINSSSDARDTRVTNPQRDTSSDNSTDNSATLITIESNIVGHSPMLLQVCFLYYIYSNIHIYTI